MGKTTGFIDHDRKDKQYIAVKKRLKSFNEFTKPLNKHDLKIQAQDVWIVEYLIVIRVVQ